jgi:cell wall-associated NlpC family hydrolase
VPDGHPGFGPMKVSMPPADPRALALALAERELGKPYLWGGDDPITGFDCSGLQVEILKATGRLPREGDWSAATLAKQFPSVATLQPGALVFWNRGTPPKIGHVEMVYAVYGDTILTIGASGGGSGTTTREQAIKDNAYTKIRPIVPGWVWAVDPFIPVLP